MNYDKLDDAIGRIDSFANNDLLLRSAPLKARIIAKSLIYHMYSIDICPKYIDPTEDDSIIVVFEEDGSLWDFEVDDSGEISILQDLSEEGKVKFFDILYSELWEFFENNVKCTK